MIINLYIIFIFHKNVINLHDILNFISHGCHNPPQNPWSPPTRHRCKVLNYLFI